MKTVIVQKDNKKLLHLTLSKNWYDKIKNGKKKVEYREYKDYWKSRIIGKDFTHILFRCGYSVKYQLLIAEIKKIYCLESGIFTDLRIEAPVFCIQFDNVEIYHRKVINIKEGIK